MKKETVFITRTGMFIALLIALQVVTKSFGQIVTGSCVNMILATCVLSCGLVSAAAVAVVSPFMAFLLGIGTPIIQIVPLIALGNLVYVAVISVLRKRISISGYWQDMIPVVTASFAKFLALFLCVTKIAVPLLSLPEAKASALCVSFSWPQLITALLGGLIATEIIRLLKKAKIPNI